MKTILLQMLRISCLNTLSPQSLYLTNRFLNSMQNVVTSVLFSWDLRLKKTELYYLLLIGTVDNLQASAFHDRLNYFIVTCKKAGELAHWSSAI